MIIKQYGWYINQTVCSNGGIGRRVGLKIQSGEDTREMLGNMASDIAKKTDEKVKDIQKKADDIVTDVQEKSEEIMGKLQDMLNKQKGEEEV